MIRSAFCQTNRLFILLEKAENEIRFSMVNGMFKTKLDIDRHGPRLMPNNCKNLNPPYFSLPSTFKDSLPPPPPPGIDSVDPLSPCGWGGGVLQYDLKQSFPHRKDQKKFTLDKDEKCWHCCLSGFNCVTCRSGNGLLRKEKNMETYNLKISGGFSLGLDVFH